MLRGNTITLRLARGHVSQTGNLFQYDYGQRLILMGVDLPNAYEVHFSNQEHGQSKTMIGDATGVDIPDEFLLSGDNIHVWIYLHDGSSDGETEYHGIIGVTKRAKPTDQQPTPVQQSVIDQTIAALNAGVTEVEGIAEGIPQTIDTALQEAKDSGEFDGFSPVIETTEITGGHQVSITDATHTETINVMDGEKGDPGRDGVDGFSPSASVSKSGKKATISITDKDGTTTAEISDGEDGQDGSDGFSPSASVSKSGNTATISITDKNGTTSTQISDGEDGQDGATGATPVISIGTVSKLSPGSDPTASMDTTDPEHPVLSLGLVTGDPGEVTEAELTAATTELKSAIDGKASLITDTVQNVAIASVPDAASNLPLTALKFKVEPIQAGSGDPSPQNQRAITGRTSAVVSVTGANLFEDSLTGKGINASGVITNSTNNNLYLGQVKEGVTYTFTNGSGTYAYAFYTAKPQDDSVSYNGSRATTGGTNFTAPIDGWVAVRLANDFASPMLVVGTTEPTSYTAYTGSQHTVQFGSTVFGGEVDWVNGKVKVTGILETYDGVNKKCTYVGASGQTGYYASSLATENGKQDNSIILCNMLKNDGTAVANLGNVYQNSNGNVIVILPDQTLTTKEAVNTWLETHNITVFHAISTPIEISLSDLDEIKTGTKGVLNVWADSGDIELMEYPCDTKFYIEKLTKPSEDDMVANNNIASGKFFMVGNMLFLSTQAIAQGANIVPGTNCTAYSLADALNAINQ